MNKAPSESLEKLDEGAYAVYLQVPGSKVVLLQAYFELYESVAVVRTIDIRSSLVCVLTTSSLLQDCIEILEQIKPEIEWRYAARPEVEPGSETHPWITAARH